MEVSPDEIIRLRARLVVAEQAALAALELVLLLRPERLDDHLEAVRKRLAQSYEDPAFAPDVINQTEREHLAKEVERLMRGLQHYLGFKEGAEQPDEG